MVRSGLRAVAGLLLLALVAGDRLLLTATDRRAKGEPKDDRLRIAALDESLGRWTTLPDSELSGGFPVGVAGSMVFPFVNYSGDEPEEPGLIARTAPCSIRPRAAGTICRIRRAGESVLASPDAILVWGGSIDQTNLASGYLLRL